MSRLLELDVLVRTEHLSSDFLYVGSLEMKELLELGTEHCRYNHHIVHPKNMRIMGLKVVEVNEYSHLGIGVRRL